MASKVPWNMEAVDRSPAEPSDSPSAGADDYLTIGALAKLCQVTVRTLRYYEEMDLIGPVKRSTGKYRLYNRHSLKRIQAILALQGLNFSLEEILSILGPYSKSRQYTKAEQIAQTRQSLTQQLSLIQDKVDQLNALSDEIRQRLSTLDGACHPCLDSQPNEPCHEHCTYFEVHH